MRRLFLLLTVMLMLCSCKDPAPERVAEVYGEKFGKIDYDREVMYIKRHIITREDMLELSITPLSRQVWRIALIVPEFPGDAEEIQAAKDFIKDEFLIEFGEKNSVDLPGTIVSVGYAFEFGSKAVRITFTDREFEALYRKENALPETVSKRKNEAARTEILILERAINEFFKETGVYPEKLDHLLIPPPGMKNWRGPYWNDGNVLPRDPWGNAFVYRRKADGFELFSTGESGREVLR